MSKGQQSHESKPLSLTEARKRINEHKLATRVEGSKQGQAVTSAKVHKPADQKGKR